MSAATDSFMAGGHQPDALAAESRALVRWLGVVLFVTIFLQRFALQVSGGLPLHMFVTLGVVGILALRGSLVVDPVRAGLLSVFACALSLSMVVNAGHASIDSAALVAITYVPFVLSLRAPADLFEACARVFQRMMLVCAVCGTLQYALQYVFPGPQLFTFQHLVPEGWLLSNLNTANPLGWGSALYKSNGFFFVEPSVFSQFLSLAILIEVLYFRAYVRLVTFVVALLLTYSGTGPLMLAILLPCAILQRRAYGLLIGLAVLAAIAFAVGDLWHLDALLHRSSEFGEQDSSATDRFIAAAWMISDTMRWSAHDVLFGYGPGSYLRFARLEAYGTHDPAWAKLLFEYGALGVVAFCAFFCRALFHAAPSAWTAAALGIGFLVFGGEFLDPRLNALILTFCVLPKPPGAVGALRPVRETSSRARSTNFPSIRPKQGADRRFQ